MLQYFIEPRRRKYVKGYEFILFAKKCKKHYWIQNAVKSSSRKVVHKAGEFLGKTLQTQ